MTTFVTHNEIVEAAEQLLPHVSKIRNHIGRTPKVYPIPRGGVPAAYALAATCINEGCPIQIVEQPQIADLFIDDIVDSGKTMKHWTTMYPMTSFHALFERGRNYHGAWLVFPWEASLESGIEDNITRLLQYVGEDPTRGGLVETPKRVAKAWKAWTSGYDQDPESILKTFEDGGEKYDEMITVRDIPFYSHCEHHLAPFFGTATITYIANGKIAGLSKLSRLLDVYARRLQVQERLTVQVADALEKYLAPKGVGVHINARHLCMESRGICKQGSSTTTTALRGVIKTDAAARAEFLAGCR